MSFFNPIINGMKKIILFLLAAGLLSGGLLVLISLPIPSSDVELPFVLDNGVPGVMKVTSPQFLRLGDEAELTLTIAFNGNQGEALAASEKIKADLQTTLLEKDPEAEYLANVSRGGAGKFSWKVTAHSIEPMKATLWCFRISEAGPELILSRDMEFSVKTLLGMRYRFARWVLGEIMLLCLILAGVTWVRSKRT